MQNQPDYFADYLSYFLPLVFSIFTSVGLAIFIGRKKDLRGSKTFTLFLLDVALWSLNTGLLELSPTPEIALIFYKLRYVSIATVPTILLIFALQYNGLFPRFSILGVLGLFTIPLISQLFIWFAPGLFVHDVVFSWNGALMLIEQDTIGPWFSVHFVYAFLSVIACVLVMLICGMQSARLMRWQAVALVLGGLPPFIVSAVLATFVDKSIALFTPLGFLIMGLVYTWALFRIRLFDLNSISRSFLFDHMGEAVLLLDDSDRLVDINQAGLRFFSQPVSQLIGKHIQTVIPIPETAGTSERTAVEIQYQTGTGPRWFSVKISQFHPEHSNWGGKLLLVEDISAQKTSQLALHQIYEITAITNAYQVLDQILALILDITVKTANSPGGFIYLLDEDEKNMLVAASQGIMPERLKSSSALAFGQKVIRLDQIIYSDAVALEFVESGGQLVGLPVKKKGRVLGTLCIGLNYTRPPSREMTDLFSAIADQIGIAVESARLLSQAEQTAVTLERQRLARELHDSVTQSIYGAVLLAKAGRNFLDQGRITEAAHTLNRVEDVTQQALKEMRLLIYEMHPLDLKAMGLNEAITQRLVTVEKRVDIQTHFIYDAVVEISGETAVGLYGIVQEALNNVLKHSHAARVVVRLQANCQTIRLVVEDNGIGFDPLLVKKMGGMGLAGMRERVERLNGTLSIHSGPETGTCLAIECPTPDDAVRLDAAREIVEL